MTTPNYRVLSMNNQSYVCELLSESNNEAVTHVLSARPCWNGVSLVKDVIIGKERCLYHAGPAYSCINAIPSSVRNSLAFGCIFEGWAQDWSEANHLLEAGEIRILSAQDYGLLVPLAGVISPSMAVIRVVDPKSGRQKFCVFNEGNEIATRLGCRDERLYEHHQWLNGEFSDWLIGCLDEPIDILPLMSASFKEGDDGHAQTGAGSRLIASVLRRRAYDTPDRIAAFLDSSSAFALNVWMAAAALMMSSAEGTKGASLVTRAGGNGRHFGYSIASDPTKWITSEAPVPLGTVESRFDGRIVGGAVGDSAVIDFLGLGGLNLASAPVLTIALSNYLPDDAMKRGESILAARHHALGGRRVGCLAERAAHYGRGPIILIGMIDAAGEVGRLGGGVVDVPGAFFMTDTSV